jgi:hypothetical protein
MPSEVGGRMLRSSGVRCNRCCSTLNLDLRIRQVCFAWQQQERCTPLSMLPAIPWRISPACPVHKARPAAFALALHCPICLGHAGVGPSNADSASQAAITWSLGLRGNMGTMSATMSQAKGSSCRRAPRNIPRQCACPHLCALTTVQRHAAAHFYSIAMCLS